MHPSQILLDHARRAEALAARLETRRTLQDVPDELLLVVFERLHYKDRLSFAQTCSRMRELARSAHVFSVDHVHTVDSPSSAALALTHHAQNLKITSPAAFQWFLRGYVLLDPPRWQIRDLIYHNDQAVHEALCEGFALLPLAH